MPSLVSQPRRGKDPIASAATDGFGKQQRARKRAPAADNGDLAANPPRRPPLSFTGPLKEKMDITVVAAAAAVTEISIFKKRTSF